MDIIQKINELKENFVNNQRAIENHKKEINVLLDNQKRMQGEYNILLELGQETGVLDENGDAVFEEKLD